MKWTSLYYGQFSWSHRYQTSYNHHLYNTDSSPLRTVPLVPHGDTKIHTIVTFLIRTPVLPPPQRPLCVVGRLGRKKKRARGARWEVSLYPSSPARFLFFRLFYFDGDTQREPLRRREDTYPLRIALMAWEMPIFKKTKHCLDRAALYFGQFSRDTKPQAITIRILFYFGQLSSSQR